MSREHRWSRPEEDCEQGDKQPQPHVRKAVADTADKAL
jgi:hypothetical protein